MTELNGNKPLNLDSFGLPPAGHTRDEELKKRTDALEEKAESQFVDRGAIPHDSSVLDPSQNREIQSHIRKSHLEVGIDHPYLKVKWVNWKNLEGTKVWEAKADGWMVATSHEFPEAKDMVREDGTIRIGDVMLMCIRMDEYLKLEQREKDKRLRQQYGIESEIRALAARNPSVFKEVHSSESGGIPDKYMSTMESNASRQADARRTVARHLGNKMKQGTVPGLPVR